MTIYFSSKIEAINYARDEMTLGRFVRLFKEVFESGLTRFRLEVA